jgi:hypothetical protein
VLSEKRAARLGWRAARRREDGGRDLRARLAWRALIRAGDRGDPRAIEAAWRVWLDAPGLESAALAGWQAPETVRELTVGGFLYRAEPLADAVVAAVTDPARPLRDRAAISALCARVGVAPGEPADRAVFYVLTSQAAQQRAADPDGALLAAGYRAAGLRVRAALRSALAGAGDLDLVRVIAGGGGPRELAADERDYLVGQLAGRRDWPSLWRATQRLPLAEAAATAGRFGDGWRPGDGEGGQELFGLLAAADPGIITAARDALVHPPAVRLRSERRPESCSFAPDGRHLAAAFHWHAPDISWALFDLADGAGSGQYWRPAKYQKTIPSFATTSVAAAGDTLVGLRQIDWDDILVGTLGHALEARRNGTAPHWIRAYPGGFMLTQLKRHSRPRPGGPLILEPDTDTVLCFCDATGRVRRRAGLLHDLGLPSTEHPARVIATEPGSGRLAVCGTRLWLLGRDAARVLASSPPLPTGAVSVTVEAGFLGPDHLATIGAGGVQVWHRRGDQLEVKAAAAFPGAWCLAAFPARGEIAVIGGPRRMDHRIRYFDAETLAEIGVPRPVPCSDIWGGPDGRCYAFWDDGRSTLEFVADACPARAVALARRPLAELVPADLAMVTAALAYGGPPAARPFLELLRAWLECRFGTEVAVGAAPAGGAADDIGLSAG